MTKEKNKLDPDFIRQLAELVQSTDLTEIEVEQDDLRIRVAREIIVQQAAIAAPVAAAPAPVAAPATAAPAPIRNCRCRWRSGSIQCSSFPNGWYRLYVSGTRCRSLYRCRRSGS